MIIRSTKKEGYAGQLSPMAMLVVLLTKHTDGIEADHLAELCEQAIKMCGSVKRALKAIERGQLKLEKMP